MYDLPDFIDDCPCGETHFLTLNRDLYGRWTIGYVEFENYTCVPGLGLDDSTTITEAVRRMQAALQRRERRGESYEIN